MSQRRRSRSGPTAESEATSNTCRRASTSVTLPLSRNSQQKPPPLPKAAGGVVWPGNGNAQSPEGFLPGIISGEVPRATVAAAAKVEPGGARR